MKNLSIYFEDTLKFRFSRESFNIIIEKIILDNHRKYGPVCIIFCSDSYMLKLNEKYLNHFYNTDIITFNYNTEEIISGDLFIGIEQVRRNAQIYDQEFHIELARVVIHGILHLVGFNDKSQADKIQMTEMENKYLNLFDFYVSDL